MASITITCDSGGSDNAMRDNGGGGSSESWAVIRAGAGTSLNGDVVVYDDTGTSWKNLTRAIFQFPLTDLLLSGATITAITFRLNVTSQDTVHTRTLAFRLVNSTPASNTAVVSTDYSQVGSTTECDTDISLGSFVIGDNDMIGNAALIALAQSKIGTYLSLGGKYVADIDNSQPTFDPGFTSTFAWSKANTKAVITYIPVSLGGIF